MDVTDLLRVMWVSWNDVFSLTLGQLERSLVSELREHRNSHGHTRNRSPVRIRFACWTPRSGC